MTECETCAWINDDPNGIKTLLLVLHWVAPTNSQIVWYSIALLKLPAKIQLRIIQIYMGWLFCSPNSHKSKTSFCKMDWTSSARYFEIAFGLMRLNGNSFKRTDGCLPSVTSLCVSQDPMCRNKVRHYRWRAEFSVAMMWHHTLHATLDDSSTPTLMVTKMAQSDQSYKGSLDDTKTVRTASSENWIWKGMWFEPDSPTVCAQISSKCH